MMLKKILHLQTELNLACGITRTISQIINTSSNDYEYHLIAFGGDGLSRFDNFKFKPTIINVNRFSYPETISFFFFLLNYCKKHSIQIIHSHHRYFDFLVWFLSPFLNVKTITSVHSKVYGKNMISYKADKIIACSEAIKNHLMLNFNIQENKIKIIYNSVDPSVSKINVDSQKLKIELGISLQDFIIGYIGRIDFKEKGIDVLLEAFKELSKTNLQSHLLMIGKGSDYSKVDNYCKLNNYKSTLLSSKKNIFEFYNLMDVIVLPSRIEPFGIVVLESGIMSKPFIGSRVDGIDELIEHSTEGLLFESGNSEDLKNKILTLFNNRELSNSLAVKLNKKVLESFTVDKIIPQYEKLYLDVLSYN